METMAHNFESQISIGGNDQSPLTGLRVFRQPSIVLLHLGFRALAVSFYIFANILASSFVIQFIVLLTLHSLDLWAVKNVTGRLLAGLRWWNFVDTEGKNHWKFEVTKAPEQYNIVEKQVFWGALVVTPLFWLLLVVTAFFTFQWQWMVIAAIGAFMTLTNLYGYLRCKWSSTQELKNYLTKWAFFSMLKRNYQGNSQQMPQNKIAETI